MNAVIGVGELCKLIGMTPKRFRERRRVLESRGFPKPAFRSGETQRREQWITRDVRLWLAGADVIDAGIGVVVAPRPSGPDPELAARARDIANRQRGRARRRRARCEKAGL